MFEYDINLTVDDMVTDITFKLKKKYDKILDAINKQEYEYFKIYNEKPKTLFVDADTYNFIKQSCYYVNVKDCGDICFMDMNMYPISINKFVVLVSN